MEPRRVRARAQRRTTILIRLATAAPYVVGFILWLVSLVVWFSLFPKGQVSTVVQQFHTFYLLALLLFWIISSTGQLPSLFFKITFRLLFTVWVVAFIALSTMDSARQSAYSMLILFLVGYLDACFEAYEKLLELRKAANHKSPALKALVHQTKALTLAMISVVHIAVAFMFRDALEKLFG